GKTAVRRQLLHAPIGRDFGAVFSVARFAMTGQQVAQAAGFTAAHGVWLTGQGKGAGAWLADLAGGQVQVDQRAVLGTAGAGLVQAHAPKAQERGCTANQASAVLQLFEADAA